MRGTPSYEGSPAQHIIEGGQTLYIPLGDVGALVALGATGYLIQPLVLQDGRRSFISWATDRPGGFDEAHLADLEALLPLLTLRLELATAHYATASLLEVYLGRNAARRVLSGAFKRGTGTSIHAALWYCDMRGFTGLGDRLEPEALVALLDRYLEALAEPVARHGGEILKFIGDAVLAIFPVGQEDPGAACRAALAAAEAALASVAAIEVPETTSRLEIGIGLHLGHVMYGNIGARERLDFTVIGSSVNEVARVEALCKEAGAPVFGPSAARRPDRRRAAVTR